MDTNLNHHHRPSEDVDDDVDMAPIPSDIHNHNTATLPPPLDVSDSESEDSDEGEVRRQAMRYEEDDQVVWTDVDSHMPPLEPITNSAAVASSSSAPQPVGLRRMRVEDDHGDDERDRRHPSQRVGDPAINLQAVAAASRAGPSAANTTTNNINNNPTPALHPTGHPPRPHSFTNPEMPTNIHPTQNQQRTGAPQVANNNQNPYRFFQHLMRQPQATNNDDNNNNNNGGGGAPPTIPNTNPNPFSGLFGGIAIQIVPGFGIPNANDQDGAGANNTNNNDNNPFGVFPTANDHNGNTNANANTNANNTNANPGVNDGNGNATPGPVPQPEFGNIGDLLARLSAAASLAGGARMQFTPLGGAGFTFPFPAGLFPFPRQESSDPARAKRLIRGLEAVPEGLVRRLERVRGTGGGMGCDETSGGDGGCAVCWERLLNDEEEKDNVKESDGDMEGEGGVDASGPPLPSIDTPSSSSASSSASSSTSASSSASSSPSASSSTSSKTKPKKSKPLPKIVALPCAHVFHSACLLPWFSRPKQTTCPTCRFNIDPDNLTYRKGSRRARREARLAQQQAQAQAQAQALNENDNDDEEDEEEEGDTNAPPEPPAPAPGVAPGPGTGLPRVIGLQVPFMVAGAGWDWAAAMMAAQAQMQAAQTQLQAAQAQMQAAQGQSQANADLPTNPNPHTQQPPPQQPQAQPATDRPPAFQRFGPFSAYRGGANVGVGTGAGGGWNPPPIPNMAANNNQAGNAPAANANAGTGAAPVNQDTNQPRRRLATTHIVIPSLGIPMDMFLGPQPPDLPDMEDGEVTVDFSFEWTPQDQTDLQEEREERDEHQAEGEEDAAGNGQPQSEPGLNAIGNIGRALLQAIVTAEANNRNNAGVQQPQSQVPQQTPPAGDRGTGGDTLNNQQTPTAAQQPQQPGGPQNVNNTANANNDPQAPRPSTIRDFFNAVLLGLPNVRVPEFQSANTPPAAPREKKKWTPPPAPGPTLRQRIEKSEREAGLRCYGVSCGVGPSDEDPFVAITEDGMKRLSIHACGKSADSTGGQVVCSHTFHSSCLVSAERIALRGADANVVGEEVEVSCPICRGIGCVSKKDWDEGVLGLA